MKLALISTLVGGLAIGFFAGAAWRSNHSAANHAPERNPTGRSALTALGSKSDRDGPGLIAGAGIDLDSLTAELAASSLADLLKRAQLPRGQFELFAYVSSLDSAGLRDLADRLQREGDLYHPGFLPLVTQIYSHWAKSDADAALEHAVAIEDSSKQQNATGIVIKQVASDDLKGAKRMLDSIEGEKFYPETLTAFCEAGVAVDPKYVFGLIDSGGVKIREYEYGQLMASWARDDVDAAATWAQTLPAGPDRREAYSSVIEVLARSQPEKAIAFVDSIESESDRTRFASTMVVHLASVAPEVALEWIRKQPPTSSIRSNATNNLVTNWARSDPDAASHFIETLEGEARKRGMKDLVSGFAFKAPERAAAILDSDVTLIDRSSISGIVYSWGDKDPQAAATWISSLPAGDAKQEAHRVVILKWAEADPTAASQWVADIPAEDTTRDWAVVYLSRGLAGSDPEAALHWASEIKDAQFGPHNLKEAAESWVEQDRTAAQAALDSGQVPEAARDALADQLAAPE